MVLDRLHTAGVAGSNPASPTIWVNKTELNLALHIKPESVRHHRFRSNPNSATCPDHGGGGMNPLRLRPSSPSGSDPHLADGEATGTITDNYPERIERLGIESPNRSRPPTR